MKVLGQITLDPTGVKLGTGYMRFVSPLGIAGLVRARSPRLDLLFVGASRPGTGQFRAFITQAKIEFDTICIWEVWNPFLGLVLQRYGFIPATDFVDNEQLTGYRWDKQTCR